MLHRCKYFGILWSFCIGSYLWGLIGLLENRVKTVDALPRTVSPTPTTSFALCLMVPGP